MINDQGPYHFIFDTGVSILIITNPDLPQKWGITPSKSIIIRGFGKGSEITAKIINGLNLRMGPIIGRGVFAAVMPPGVLEFSNFVGMQIDGIIGYDLVKDFRVKINFDNTMMKFESPQKPFRNRNYVSLPLEIDKTQAFIHAVINQKGKSLPVKLLLDTGGGNTVFLDLRTLENFNIPEESPHSNLGWGINGSIDGKLSRLDYLDLNGILIKKPVCAFPNYGDSSKNSKNLNGNGNIGNEILRRFTLIIDYPNKGIFLKKHPIFKSPYDYDMSGINLAAIGNSLHQFVISTIDPNSPGEKAGLKEGDIVLMINDLPCLQYSLADLDALFKSGDQKKIFLGVFRQGNYFETVVTLKRRV
jgi:hypothetical protein